MPYDLGSILQNGMEFQESFQSILCPPQFLVDKAKVVQSLAACGFYIQSLTEELHGFFIVTTTIKAAPFVD